MVMWSTPFKLSNSLVTSEHTNGSSAVGNEVQRCVVLVTKSVTDSESAFGRLTQPCSLRPTLASSSSELRTFTGHVSQFDSICDLISTLSNLPKSSTLISRSSLRMD